LSLKHEMERAEKSDKRATIDFLSRQLENVGWGGSAITLELENNRNRERTIYKATIMITETFWVLTLYT